jgi:hypothetical protein
MLLKISNEHNRSFHFYRAVLSTHFFFLFLLCAGLFSPFFFLCVLLTYLHTYSKSLVVFFSSSFFIREGATFSIRHVSFSARTPYLFDFPVAWCSGFQEVGSRKTFISGFLQLKFYLRNNGNNFHEHL